MGGHRVSSALFSGRGKGVPLTLVKYVFQCEFTLFGPNSCYLLEEEVRQKAHELGFTAEQTAKSNDVLPPE